MTEQTAAMAPADAFGAELYSQLAADQASLVFSPVSVSAALRLAWYGARGETRAELSRALHLDSGTGFTEPASSGSFTFRMANTAWVQRGLPIEPEYTRELSDEAMTTFADADFAGAPDQARAEINATIAAQTGQKIRDLLSRDDVTATTKLVLANAVYLKARWSSPFPEQATADAPFHPGAGASVTVPMMRATATFQYKRGDGYQCVLLPYAESPLAMAIVLPDGPVAGLNLAAGLHDLLAGTARYQVTLSLPRFRLETRTGLIPALRGLGIRQAFTGAADFTGITAATRLMIGAVAHMAYIDVDEHGTEAAAATAVTMLRASAMLPLPRVELVVDRPFLFAIVDTTTAAPFFLGHLTTPR